MNKNSINVTLAYANIIDFSLRETENLFTESELCLIADALNGIMFHKWQIDPKSTFSANVKEAIRHGELDRKWEVDRIGFYTKLDGLTNAQAAAAIHAIEAWWDNPSRQLNADGFAEYGLICSAAAQSNTAKIP